MRSSLLLAAALATACRKAPSYDRSTPEKTLASFFKALEAKRIPEDLDRLVIVDAGEEAAWKARCQPHGCTGGSFRVVERPPSGEYEATLVGDYRITGRDDALVMRGQHSPVQLLREPEGWRITQFGKVRRQVSGPKSAPAGDAGAAPSADGGAAAPP
ncbi:MAG TPA: hypothetical protein VMZ28_31355 [Kofleriaceae bacterium]|nr:hypothetical protein [Kofleriaceae bacterium]